MKHWAVVSAAIDRRWTKMPPFRSPPLPSGRCPHSQSSGNCDGVVAARDVLNRAARELDSGENERTTRLALGLSVQRQGGTKRCGSKPMARHRAVMIGGASRPILDNEEAAN